MIEVTNRKTEPFNWIRFQECEHDCTNHKYVVSHGQKIGQDFDYQEEFRIRLEDMEQVREYLGRKWLGDVLITKIGDNYDQDRTS